jgi:hypothetical protein
MKPNGKRMVLRFAMFAAFLAVCTALGQAETHGKFTLTSPARWGSVLLAPGEYEFYVSENTTGRMVTVASLDSGSRGMILAVSATPSSLGEASHLVVSTSAEGSYIRALYLTDPGVKLEFAAGTGKFTRMGKASAPASTMMTASGRE